MTPFPPLLRTSTALPANARGAAVPCDLHGPKGARVP